MTDQTRTQIINDAIENGMLIETCLGCGGATSSKGAKLSGIKECNDCPAGSGLTWNPKALKAISGKPANDQALPQGGAKKVNNEH